VSSSVRWLVVAVAIAAASSCDSGDASGRRETLPLGITPSENTGPAEELAPSQLTGSTVAAPDTPGPCDVDQLEFWTAQVAVAATTADAVIRVRNRGDVWCELDISGSSFLDREIEPDVWLDPGGWADLVVAGEPGCDESVAVTAIAVDVDGVEIDVGSAVIDSCGWKLAAFFPNEVAEAPCADTEAVVVDGFVLVRNSSFRPCVLGALLAVEGAGAGAEPASARVEPALPDLAAGDVVAFPYRVAGGSGCGPEPSARLTFDSSVVIDLVGVRCGAIHELGPGRPYFGTEGGPLADHRAGPLDLDGALAALDPFASAE
jgi:hypothetical protein